jgi:hypothetical protein
MATRPAEETPTPQSIASYVKTNAAQAKKAQHMHEENVVTRETDYKGHHIVVRTKYEVEVDGKQLMGHLGVNDAGSVHYHPIPNMSFTSALDMIKKVIDVFPNDFGSNGPPNPGPHPMPPMGHHSGNKSGMAKKNKTSMDNTAAKRRKR